MTSLRATGAETLQHDEGPGHRRDERSSVDRDGYTNTRSTTTTREPPTAASPVIERPDRHPNRPGAGLGVVSDAVLDGARSPAATIRPGPVRLELCLEDPLCPVVGDLPDPTQPLSYPDNFPDESFWWSGEAAFDTPSGASALLVLAQEAAFGGTGEVAVGEQVSFARLRIRLDDVEPGETYTGRRPPTASTW